MFKRTKKAFTLLELIVAVSILGILASIAIPTYNNVFGNTNQETANQNANVVARQANADAARAGHDATVSGDITTAATANGVTLSGSAPWKVIVGSGDEQSCAEISLAGSPARATVTEDTTC